MGYDLRNDNGSGFRFNADEFREVIQLAMRGGWKPAGIIHSSDRWDGRYLPNEGQTVTAQDAFASAKALETVVSAVPQPSFAPKKVITVKFLLTEEKRKTLLETYIQAWQPYKNTRKWGDDLVIMTLEEYTAQNVNTSLPVILVLHPGENWNYDPFKYGMNIAQKEAIREFIAFCHQGAFRILQSS
jgi:hypothetical protein